MFDSPLFSQGTFSWIPISCWIPHHEKNFMLRKGICTCSTTTATTSPRFSVGQHYFSSSLTPCQKQNYNRISHQIGQPPLNLHEGPKHWFGNGSQDIDELIVYHTNSRVLNGESGVYFSRGVEMWLSTYFHMQMQHTEHEQHAKQSTSVHWVLQSALK